MENFYGKGHKMKNQWILAILCGGLILGGGAAVNAAQPGMRDGAFAGPPRHCMAGEEVCPAPWPHMLDRLDLSDAQQQEVKKLLDGHRERADKLHARLREAGRHLRQAMGPQKFDEKALRKLAAEKSAIQTDMLVERAKTHSRIYALLTPEQQELADLAAKLRRLQGHGPMHRGRPMPMESRGEWTAD